MKTSSKIVHFTTFAVNQELEEGYRVFHRYPAVGPSVDYHIQPSDLRSCDVLLVYFYLFRQKVNGNILVSYVAYKIVKIFSANEYSPPE